MRCRGDPQSISAGGSTSRIDGIQPRSNVCQEYPLGCQATISPQSGHGSLARWCLRPIGSTGLGGGLGCWGLFLHQGYCVFASEVGAS
jgi:hypothetical protein